MFDNSPEEHEEKKDVWLKVRLSDGREAEISESLLLYWLGVPKEANEANSIRLVPASEWRDDYANECDGPNYEPVLSDEDVEYLREMKIDGREQDCR
jgi:hypothetical protein